MIYLTGDVHGQLDIAKLYKKNFPEQDSLTRNDYLIQLGDLGLLWKKDKTFEYLLDFYSSRKYTLLWVDGNHCFHKNTEILTNKGFKNIVQVYQNYRNYKLAQFNLQSKEITYSFPLKAWKSSYSSAILVEGERTCQFVSPNHFVVTDTEKVSAGTLLNKKLPEITVPVSGNLNTDDLSISDNLIRLLTNFAFDGRYDILSKSVYFRRIQPEKVNMLESLLISLQIQFVKKRNNKMYKYSPYTFYISEKFLNDLNILMEVAYGTLCTFTFPSFFRNLSFRQFNLVIEELKVLTNFSDKDNKLIWMTNNKINSDIFQELCLKHGYTCVIEDRETKKDKKFYKNLVYFDNSTQELTIREIKYEQAEDMYCFSMPEGTLITRYFGKIAFSGNCNFDMLKEYPQELWHGGKVHRIADNILHLQRGQFFQLENSTFFTFGGAWSPDKSSRLIGIDWWSDEEFNLEEYEESEYNLKEHYFKTDYVLTHDAPQSLLQPMFFRNFTSSKTSKYLDEIYFRLNFTHWYFGHYHVDKTYGKFTCLYNTIIKPSSPESTAKAKGF